MFHILMSSRVKRGNHKILRLLSRFNPCNKWKTGFTLAEVLITLLIIGVIASLVIPNLINDLKDAELKTAWKKAYSSINQAFGEILMDNGGTFAGAAEDYISLRSLFKNKMNSLSTCNDSTSCNSYSLKKLNGTSDAYALYFNLILNDGTIIFFALDSASCTHSFYVYNNGGECGWLIVDINGRKNPNQWGKDIYGIWIVNNKILPWGADPVGTASASFKEDTCNSSGSGFGCGAKYLHE